MTDFMRSAFAKKGQEHELVGTNVQVGDYNFAIKKVVAQGGFGFIFLVVDGAGRSYALKRIIASGETEKVVKREISTLKLVSGHPNIVEFVTAAAIPAKNTKHGNTEFLIIQELCSAPLKSVLDPLMAENEFRHDQRLHCFHKICEAVAHMHMLKPPVVHRDLKIDNVLLSASGEIKLCDFGSATTTIYQPTLDWNHIQRETAEDEINRNTTPIFRAPEMLDLYTNMIIGPKADIWALGCLLYQLCFGSSPFEESGKLGSLNGKYRFPPDSPYQDYAPLIQGMLTVDVKARWNIQKVLEEVETLARKLRIDLFNPLPYPLVAPPGTSLTDGAASATAVGDLLSSAGASLTQGGSKLLGFMKGGAGSLMKGIKETSTKVVSTVQGLSKGQLDLSYITARILVLGAPSTDVPEALSGNPVNDACEYFEQMPGHQHMVFNLNDRAYDEGKYHGRVVMCAWKARSTPQLRQILAFCRHLHKYLTQTQDGVAIIHCDDGRSQVALAVASYFLFCKMFKLPSTSLVMYGKKRFPGGHRGLVLPSHKRYLDYMTRMVNEQEHQGLHCRRFRLKQLVLSGIPKFNLHRSGCKPLFEVVNGDSVSWLSADPQQLERCRSYTDTDGGIVIPLQETVVGGDVRVAVHHIRHLSTLTTSTVRMFSFSFHTAFVSPTSDCLLYKLSEIDSITSNAAKFPPNFTATLHFEVLPEGNSDRSLAIWSKAIVATGSRVCFGSSAEEDEIREKYGRLDLRTPSPAAASTNGRNFSDPSVQEEIARPFEDAEGEGAFNLLADCDDDEEDDEGEQLTSHTVMNTAFDDDAGANSTGAAPAAVVPDLLGGLGETSGQPSQQPALNILDFDSAPSAPAGAAATAPAASPSLDLFGMPTTQQAADPFGGLSHRSGPSPTQPATQPSQDLFDQSSAFSSAPTAPAQPAANSGGDLLGGMAEMTFDPFSSAPSSGIPSPQMSGGASRPGAAGQAASPAADLMGGGNAGFDLMGGMQNVGAGNNLMGGNRQSNSSFQPMGGSTQTSSSDLLGGGMGAAGYGGTNSSRNSSADLMGGFSAAAGGGGGGRLSGASSPYQSQSPVGSVPRATSPMSGYSTSGFAPVGTGGMYGGNQQQRPAMGYQSGGAGMGAGAAKSADPFAQLGAFGAPASKGVPSSSSQTSINLGVRGAAPQQQQAGSRPSSRPPSGVASPANSGRSTPLHGGTGLSSKPVYTSVIGGRDERGTRLGGGGAGIPPKVEAGAFTDLLSSQGFQSDKQDKNVSLKNMRNKDLEKTMDPVKLQVMKWTEGKRKNIRALIAALPEVLWESATWTPVEMHKLVQPNDIKKAYRKACLCVHPDKLTGEPEEELAKAIFVELNEAWTAFEQNKDMTRVA
eukprot:scpid20330/ scgid23411/ Cyclin-G-associated kinase